MFQRLLGRVLGVDNIFRRILEDEFWSDLSKIVMVYSESFCSNSDMQIFFNSDLNEEGFKNDLLDLMREKYKNSGRCPSLLFSYASKSLQEEYKVVHSLICSFLYS